MTTDALVLQEDAGSYPYPWTIAADGEDGGADGWSIADARHYRSGSSSVENSNGLALAQEVTGPLHEDTEEPALISATVVAASNTVTLAFDEGMALPSTAAEAIMFLAGLTFLERLNLAELGRLDLSGNAVADVSALADVPGLVRLRLPGNPLSNAAPLAGWRSCAGCGSTRERGRGGGTAAARRERRDAAMDRADAGAVSTAKAGAARGWA